LHLLFKEFSNNHEIMVYDTTELYGEKGKFRVMQFSNKAIQGAMDLNNPERIVFEYPRAIIHLMEFNDPSFEDVFIIGHGIGTIAGHFSDKRFKIAEIDNKVVELSKMCFGYNQNNVIVGDGRHILESEQPHIYDYIILDAFTGKGTPKHLTSKEFFRITREKLDSEGSIILNLIGKGESDKLINAIHTTLSGEYAYIKSFSLPSEGVTDIQNIIIIGRKKPIAFQLRNMAGFIEIELGQGHIIMDSDPQK
jgi:spermidine synthase